MSRGEKNTTGGSDIFDLLKTMVVSAMSMQHGTQTLTLPHFGGHQTIIELNAQMVTQQGVHRRNGCQVCRFEIDYIGYCEIGLRALGVAVR